MARYLKISSPTLKYVEYIMESITFPSQGDLLKFFYNATGIVSKKGEDLLDIDLSAKSRHKALTRIAEEEGCNFLENFNTYSSELFSTLSSLVIEDKFKEILTNPLIAIFKGYLHFVLTESACLDKKHSIENIIERFIVNIAQACFPAETHYKYLINQSYPQPPNLFIWLKDSEKTPFMHAMNWIYDSEEMSYQVFHQLEDIDQMEKDLINIENWLNGKVFLPNMSQIISTFHRAFRHKKIKQEIVDTYTLFLLISRFLTFCKDRMSSMYGDLYTSRYIDLFIQAYSAVKRDFNIIFDDLMNEKEVALDFKENKEITLNCIHQYNTSIFEKNYTDVFNSSHPMQLLDISIPKDQPYHAATVHIHRYLGLTGKSEKLLKPFEPNIENLFKAYDLIDGKESNYDLWVTDYKKVQNDEVYPWLKNWVDAVFLFKQKKYDDALDNMHDAFKGIRYSAAKKMVDFLDSYIILSLLAKDKSGWKDFRIAFKWGVFLNQFGGELRPFYQMSDETDIRKLFEDKILTVSLFKDIKDLKTLAKLVLHWQYS